MCNKVQKVWKLPQVGEKPTLNSAVKIHMDEALIDSSHQN